MMKKNAIKTYSELIQLDSFLDRFNYLKLDGSVGIETFGFDRYLNQALYLSQEWNKVRRHCIIRDFGCDLGIRDREIQGKIIVHHMNPITEKDIYNRADYILDPEFLICVAFNTHNAIHYGSEDLLILDPVERFKNDTCPWKL